MLLFVCLNLFNESNISGTVPSACNHCQCVAKILNILIRHTLELEEINRLLRGTANEPAFSRYLPLATMNDFDEASLIATQKMNDFVRLNL